MGMFFDEKKAPEPDKKTSQSQQGFFSLASLMLLAGLMGFLSWIFKPLLTWAFNFENKTRRQITIQLVVVSFVFGVPLYLLYNIPVIRDFTSLSRTHTLNMNKNGYRILFPDRQYFVSEGERRMFRAEQYGTTTYFTYSGYTKYVAQKMSPNTCHLVPRGGKIVLASKSLPIQAEGFDDVVIYPMKKNVAELSGWRYLAEIFNHPSYVLKNRSKLSDIEVTYEYESSWNEFINSWNEIESMTNNYKPFELKARSDEHAIVCF